MYLYAALTIDPSQLTHLDRVKPTKGFARLANILTGGLVTSKEERETFCAVTILQQINVVMRSLGVNNVIRLAKDDIVFFEDTEGKEGDLRQAFDAFTADAKPEDISLFNSLKLVLEHHTKELGYLIDIRIDRTHRVGEHPIQITLNALPKELSAASGKDYDRRPLYKVFASQETYDSFITRYKQLFTAFLNDMEAAFKKHMKVDDVSVTSRVKIIRPSKRIAGPADVPRSSSHDPVYHDYDPVYHDFPGFGDAFFFAWLWSDLCHSNEIQCHDCTLVDSTGADVLSVGAEGFQAGEGTTMDVDEPFSPPAGVDLQVFGDNEYSAEIASDSPKYFETLGAGDTESGGWLGSLGDSFGGDASGCGGGGCGGCGGGE